MHFAVNLDKRNSDTRKIIRIAMILLFVVPGVALLFSVLQWTSLGSEQNKLASALEKMDARSANHGLSPQDMSRVNDTLRRLNEWVGHQGEPAESILLALGDSLPVNVKVEEVSYSAVDATGQLSAVSTSDIQLSDFVRKLEAAPPIDRVVVTRQGSVEEGADQLREYDIFLAAEN